MAKRSQRKYQVNRRAQKNRIQTAAHFDSGTHLLGLNLITYTNQEISLLFLKIDRRQNLRQPKTRIFTNHHTMSEFLSQKLRNFKSSKIW